MAQQQHAGAGGNNAAPQNPAQPEPYVNPQRFITFMMDEDHNAIPYQTELSYVDNNYEIRWYHQATGITKTFIFIGPEWHYRTFENTRRIATAFYHILPETGEKSEFVLIFQNKNDQLVMEEFVNHALRHLKRNESQNTVERLLGLHSKQKVDDGVELDDASLSNSMKRSGMMNGWIMLNDPLRNMHFPYPTETTNVFADEWFNFFDKELRNDRNNGRRPHFRQNPAYNPDQKVIPLYSICEMNEYESSNTPPAQNPYATPAAVEEEDYRDPKTYDDPLDAEF